jgi:hypothetical protein
MRGTILVALSMGAIALAGANGAGAAAAAVAADGRTAQNATVTWVGTVGLLAAMQPSPWDAAHRPNVRLVVSAAAIDATFEGYTGATHDSPTARTTCWVHYRFVKRQGSWSYYRQVGAARYVGNNGYVANAPCIGRVGGAVKTITAGSKLRADFGLWGDVATYYRSYLRRA